MGYSNSPLTLIVSPAAGATFELYNPLDGIARLEIPAGGINKEAPVTFRYCGPIEDFEIDLKLKKKQTVASDVFEIEFPEDVKLTDILLSIPVFNWTDDIKKIRLFEQDRGANWQHTTCKVLMTPDGTAVDHFEIGKAQHYSYYVAAYENV